MQRMLAMAMVLLSLAIGPVFAQAELLPQAPDRVSLFFGGGSYVLRPSQAEKLQRFLDAQLDIAAYRLEVQGHRDDIGNRVYNLRLSAARAEVVVQRLLEYAIPASSIEVLPLGEDAPRFDNRTWEGKLSNRRVDVILKRLVL